MTMPRKTVTCPDCKRGGRRVTKAGKIWSHQPYGKDFSGTMVLACPGSGKPAYPPKPSPVVTS
jgi:hypothetical protein